MAKNPPAMQKTQVRSLVQEDPLEKEMTTHSSILAWKIPWMDEPGRLQSIGSQRVDYITMLLEDSSSAGKESPCNAGDPGSIPGGRKICWRRDRLPTPVFLPGESHGQWSLSGYGP